MTQHKGTIVLMGSGELTATMVEIHKSLLAQLGSEPRAVFIDTPAGFQLNVDEISRKAVGYFRDNVKYPMAVASFKSIESCTPYEAEQTFHDLRQADYVLIGPGSPSYAVRQLQQTPIPKILTSRIESGACLVAASAAALTVGRFTMPVYEIYKVGTDLHWVEGMDILGSFGFNLVVIPHWNNAEGGTHDTRFCYMGEPRFRKLEQLLPDEVSILGLDEHTACIMDLEANEATIKGIGSMTLRRGTAELTFEKGERFSLDVLRGKDAGKAWHEQPAEQSSEKSLPDSSRDTFWEKVHASEDSFHAGLEQHDLKQSATALLEIDRLIWQAHEDHESTEFISQARDILRDMVVFLATRLDAAPRDQAECLAPLVNELLSLRKKFRQDKKWQEADEIRDSLQKVNIIIEDSKNGSLWKLKS